MLFVEAVSAFAKSSHGRRRAERQQQVRHAARFRCAKWPKTTVKISRGQHRLEDDPGSAERGLLVPDLHVAPDEEVEELAVVPQLAEVERPPAALRPDHGDALLRIVVAARLG